MHCNGADGRQQQRHSFAGDNLSGSPMISTAVFHLQAFMGVFSGQTKTCLRYNRRWHVKEGVVHTERAFFAIALATTN